LAVAACTVALGWSDLPTQALTIQVTDIGGFQAGSVAYKAFRTAASLWEDAFRDDVTVRINVGFSSQLASNVVSSTSEAMGAYTYAAVRNALAGDVTSATDASAVAHLQPGPALKMVTVNASGAVAFDNDGSLNNTYLKLSLPNARALHLAADTGGVDSVMDFNSNLGFDYDRTNGLSGYDFIGVAMHEIATVLGFFSGVDMVDLYRSLRASTNNAVVATTLDLFRFSSKSLGFGPGVIDLADGDASYFSVDSGAINISYFSTGKVYGDGYQAGHWKIDSGGIMVPAAGRGEEIDVAAKDFTALDAIGWDIRPKDLKVTVPEPGTIATFAAAIVVLFRTLRRDAGPAARAIRPARARRRGAASPP
jgi:hypothetical protein